MLTFRNKFTVCASRQAVSKLTAWNPPYIVLWQMQSWFRMEKTTEAAIGYNVLVANNNFRYNLRLPWRKKKNSSQFITRIASHPRNKSVEPDNFVEARFGNLLT